VSQLSEIAWSSIYEEMRQRSTQILKEAGDEVYEEMKPYVTNIAKWGADYGLALAQGEPGSSEALTMLVHQTELVGLHIAEEGKKAFWKLVYEDLEIIGRVVGTILITAAKAALV
jgi:hypothetical protein